MVKYGILVRYKYRLGLKLSEEFGGTDRIPVYFEDELVYGRPYGEDSADSEFIYGDLNNDKKVDVTDLSFLSLYLIGDMKFSDIQKKAGDVSTDESVNLADLARFRQYLSKKPGVTLGPKK